jgi:HEAT repeat protein
MRNLPDRHCRNVMTTHPKERHMNAASIMNIWKTLTACVIFAFISPQCVAQAAPSQKAWALLEAGLKEKRVSDRAAAVRVLGLIHEDPHAADLAETALKDETAMVRAAAATALGQMHAVGADAELKQALNDKNLPVVMAAAHALHLLNDPACYEVYYAVLTGERKDNSGMVAQEMQVLHDPKQLAAMGFEEGAGYVPFAGMGWEAMQTIMKDRKSGDAAKVALISALTTDPDPRVNPVLLKETESPRWVLRVAALETISKRGNPALLPGIEKALDDPKIEVKDTAAATIIHLTNIQEGHVGAKSAIRSE